MHLKPIEVCSNRQMLESSSKASAKPEKMKARIGSDFEVKDSDEQK